MLEDGLNAPEAAAGKNGCFLSFCGGQRSVNGGFRKCGFSACAAVVGFDGRPGKDSDSRKNQYSNQDSAHSEHSAGGIPFKYTLAASNWMYRPGVEIRPVCLLASIRDDMSDRKREDRCGQQGGRR